MNPEQNRIGQLLDWLFRAADGKIVIAQFPNWPLWTWLGATVLQSMTLMNALDQAMGWIGTLALAWWAYLEMTEGVNGFRRILGGVVLIYIGLSRTQMI